MVLVQNMYALGRLTLNMWDNDSVRERAEREEKSNKESFAMNDMMTKGMTMINNGGKLV